MNLIIPFTPFNPVTIQSLSPYQPTYTYVHMFLAKLARVAHQQTLTRMYVSRRFLLSITRSRVTSYFRNDCNVSANAFPADARGLPTPLRRFNALRRRIFARPAGKKLFASTGRLATKATTIMAILQRIYYALPVVFPFSKI